MAEKQRLSIIIPSFKRQIAVIELLGRLKTQELQPFEIVIVEQSEDPDFVKNLQGYDSCINVITSPPVGPAAARNIGIRHSTGDILLFIDDDDLPIDNQWTMNHMKNYDDSQCSGVIGRLCWGEYGARL